MNDDFPPTPANCLIGTMLVAGIGGICAIVGLLVLWEPGVLYLSGPILLLMLLLVGMLGIVGMLWR